MQKDQSLHLLGKISKTHGFGGTLVLISDRPVDDAAEDLQEVFVKIDGLFVPFPVEDATIRTDTSMHLKLEFIENSDKAAELVGCEVYAEQAFDDLVSEPESEYLIGFSVHDAACGYIGVVRQMEDYNGNIVLQVMNGEKETLISLYPELITEIDDEAKVLHITAPDGYFE